jgi:hypothetical protein
MIFSPVLNPSIRMSWIKKHWEEEYIEDAKEKILERVSCSHNRESEVLIWIVKMLEYRKNTITEEEQPKAPSASSLAPQFMSLAEQYGMGDEMEIGSSGTGEQTIEQEYESYTTAPLSPKMVNILKFWEVSQNSYACGCRPDSILNIHYILILRLMALHFPLCLRWRWIICQFKLPLYLVNGSSHQVRKLIPRSEPESMPC